jgi:hypothetical protein
VAFSIALIGKRDYSTAYVSKGLPTATRDMADHCHFYILFRFGGQYGDKNPLPCRRPPPDMYRVVADVRATVAGVFEVGEAQKGQLDILEIYGG